MLGFQRDNLQLVAAHLTNGYIRVKKLKYILISSSSLKFTIFLYLSPTAPFDIADPSSMQDACHHELSKYDLCSPRVSQ